VLSDRYPAELEAIFAKYPDKRSAVLPALYLAQETYGHINDEAIQDVAELLELDPTQVLSIAGFYTLFYEEPVGKYVLEICNDLPCALRGASDLVKSTCQKLGIEEGGTTEDGMFTVKTVMCLAACDKAPMLQVNLRFEENLNEEKVDALIERLRNEDSEGIPSYFGVEALKEALKRK
jgi:NADH-quinone oxidoreductase subunit E